MGLLANLFVRIGAQTQEFDRGIAKAATRMKRFGSEMASAGMAMSAAFTLPLAAIGYGAVKAFADFDAAMTASLAIMGDVSKVMREDMVAAAREISKVTTFSATQAGQAYYYLASAGMTAAESVKALPVVAKFAQAGLFDMARATELLADAQSALGLRIRDDAVKNMANMIRVSDVLVKANTLANATVEQFSQSLTNKAAAALRIVGKEIEEGVAVLAAFADQGVKGEEAGERLAIVMRDLQRAAIENRAKFREVGVSVYDASGKMRNMADIVGDLEKAMAGMSDEQKKTLLMTMDFQERSVSALLTIIGFSKEIRRYEQELRKAGGTTEDVAKKQLQTFNAQLTLLKHAIMGAASSLGESLVPRLLSVMDHLKPMIAGVKGLSDAFGQLPSPVQTATISLLASVAVAGSAVVVFGKLYVALGTLGLAFAKLAALGIGAWLAGVGLALQTGLVVGLTTAQIAMLALLKVTALLIAAWVGWNIGKVVRDLTGLGGAVDSVWRAFDPLLNKLGLTTQKMKAEIQAEQDAAFTRQRLIASLVAHGAQMDFATMATDDLRAAAIKLTSAQQGQIVTTETLSRATDRMMTLQELVNKEIGERGQSAIKKIVDAMADHLEASKPWGKQLELEAGIVDDFAFRMNLLSAEIQRMRFPTTIAMVDPKPWQQMQGTIMETIAIMHGVGLKTQMEYRAEAERLGAVWQRNIDLQELGTEAMAEQGLTVLDVKRSYDAWTEAEARAAGLTIEHAHKAVSAWKELGREISSAMKNMSRGIADIIVEGGKMGKVFVDVAKQIAKAIIEIIILQAVKMLIRSLAGVLDHLGAIGKALKDWAGAAAEVTKTTAKIAGAAAPAATAAGGAGAGGGAAGGGTGAGFYLDAASLGWQIGATIGEAMRSWAIANYLADHLVQIEKYTMQTAQGAMSVVTAISDSLGMVLMSLSNIWEQIGRSNTILAKIAGIPAEGFGFRPLTMPVGGGNTINIQIYESKSARETAQEVVTLLKRHGIAPAMA